MDAREIHCPSLTRCAINAQGILHLEESTVAVYTTGIIRCAIDEGTVAYDARESGGAKENCTRSAVLRNVEEGDFGDRQRTRI